MDGSQGRECDDEREQTVERDGRKYRRNINQSPSNSTLTTRSSVPMKQHNQRQQSNPTFLQEMDSHYSSSKEHDNCSNLYYSENEEEDASVNCERDVGSVPQSISTETSSHNTDSRSRRQMSLIKSFSEGRTLTRNENTMRILMKNVRKLILPEVKFVPTNKGFGTFEQPDFTDDNCWMNHLFANIPTLKNATDTMKAEVWMTYKSKIKNEFSLHRSAVTLKIKRKFSEGKTY